MACKEIGQWFTDKIEKPLNEWRDSAIQSCTEARRWLEQRRTEIENWRNQQETRCKEQKCQWLCLCCNKLFCWLVDILVRIVTVIIDVFEHVVEAVCTLIVTLIWLVLMIIVQSAKWIILAVVCTLEALCPIAILVGAAALLIGLLGVVALAAPALAAIAAPIISPAIAAAIVALTLARLLCEASKCRVLGAIGWALKWAIVLGAVIALIALSPLSGLVVAIFGGLVAALIVKIEKIPCTLPPMLGLP